MNVKLTLRLDESVIARIKNYAANRHLSLSRLTENLFRQILASEDQNTNELSPIVKKYKGILRTRIQNERDEITDYLLKKH